MTLTTPSLATLADRVRELRRQGYVVEWAPDGIGGFALVATCGGAAH